MSSAEIRPVSSRRELAAFVRLPARLYRDDPAWVAPLRRHLLAHLDRWTSGRDADRRARLFLAWRGGRPVGRVSAHVDRVHNRVHGDRRGFFGFFECENDPATTRGLLAAAGRWLEERDRDEMMGPMSFTINEEVGLLVDGFEHPPYVMTAHGRPCYQRLLTAAGLARAKDLYAWRYDPATPLPAALARADRWRERRSEVVFRAASLGRIDSELAIVGEIFNDAWSDNWGFVPLGETDLRVAARDLATVLVPGTAFVVEIEGEPAAVCLAVRNLNEALHGLDGRLTPLNAARLIWRLRVRPPRTARLMLLGIRKKFRRYGSGLLALAVVAEIRRRGRAAGIRECELSWTLEDNHAINKLIALIGAERYKTYRVFATALPLS